MNELSSLVIDLFAAVSAHKHVEHLYHGRHDQCFSQDAIERRESDFKESQNRIEEIFLDMTQKAREL